MEPVFLDSSFVIALEVADDSNHGDALRQWHKILKRRPLLITTALVFSEIVTFFNVHNHHAKAVEVGNRLLKSPSVDLIHMDQMLLHEAWRYFQKHADRTYSLTDCLSFVIMRRRRIKRALAFDKHFSQAGFPIV